jgi:exonuclease III
VDIVLKERLTPEIIANIRLNKEDPYKAGSDGDMFLAVATALSNMTVDLHPTGEGFSKWATREHGASMTQGPRLKTILTNTKYSRFAKKVVETSWGRKNFVIEHFDKLCSQHVANVDSMTNQRTFI